MQKSQCHFLVAQILIVGASRMAQWSRALHRSFSCATRDPGFTVGRDPTGSVTVGRDQEVSGATHNWPSVVREGLASRWRAGRIGVAGFRIGCALC